MNSYLENPEEEAKEYSARYKILYLAILISGLILFVRLWHLQIITGKELRAYSEQNRVKERKIPAPRGLILDREGRVLVENLPGYAATITPQYASRLEDTAEVVGQALDLPAQQVIQTTKKSRRQNGPFYQAKIKENLNLNEVFRLKQIRFDHPGLNIYEGIVRHYPLKESGAQLLGYVGEISKRQIKKYNSSSRKFHFEQGDIIGKRGLEKVWENEIRGFKGSSFVEVDARGREAKTDTQFFGLKLKKETPGHNLVLTLDQDIQQAADQAMRRDDRVGTRIGSAVAMKSNGEILAWVSSPSYDPNEFSTRISNAIWSKLVNDPFKPLRNKVVQDHYAPGSTFKPIVALAALQEGAITKNTVIFSPGSMRYGRRTYHDSSRGGHGNITVFDAIERSGNIFFYKMGIALGIDKIAQYANLFGFGSRTQIKLNNERPGLMPTSQWKLKTIGEAWQPGESLSNAIGQGFVLTTALQMAVAYNSIGMEGLVYKPYIVKKIINHDDDLVQEHQPTLVRDISLPNTDGTFIEKKHFKTIKKAMTRVVQGDRGTARRYRIPGIKMAGKTGTSQVISFSAETIYDKCEERPLKQRHHGWFVGWAPADKPEITVAVLTEHSCHGGSGSAPIVRDIILAYMMKHHPERLKLPKTKKVATKRPESQ